MTGRLIALALASVLASCGGSATSGSAASGGSGGASGGSAGTGGASGGSGGQNSGDCATDAACGTGTCVELSPGGYRACRVVVSEATQCPPAGSGNQCCSSADCKTGKCYEWPTAPECSGMVPAPHNVCASDGCQNNADCSSTGTEGICVPGGVWSYKVAGCLTVACRKDSECTAGSGGRCLPLQDPCCGVVEGMYCQYPDNGCKAHACGQGQYCAAVADPTHGGQVTAHCIQGYPACPA